MVKAILAHKSFFLKKSTALNFFSDICIQQIEYTKSRLYERQGAYAQGHDDACKEHAQLMVDAGILTPEKAAELFKVPKKEILPRNR